MWGVGEEVTIWNEIGRKTGGSMEGLCGTEIEGSPGITDTNLLILLFSR